MSDLDARVAALIAIFDAHGKTFDFRSRVDMVAAIRAELQKPAQEEITDAAFAAAVQHCEIHGIVEITPESLEDIVNVVIRASKGEKT